MIASHAKRIEILEGGSKGMLRAMQAMEKRIVSLESQVKALKENEYNKQEDKDEIQT